MTRKPIIRTLAGLGLTAGLFVGCQDFLGTKSDNAGVSGDATAALLQLAVKDSGACVDLHARCMNAHSDGKDSADLDTTLVDKCIIDTAAAHRISEGRFEDHHGGHDGRGPGGRGDDDGPRLDSAAAKALCDSMTTVLAGTDTASVGYLAVKHAAAEACEEHTMMGGFEGREGHGHRGRH